MAKKEALVINQKVSSKRLLSMGDIKLAKLRIRFDIQTLNMMIAFLLKDSVLRTRKTIQNINKLMNNIEPEMYEKNLELSTRVWTIQQIVKCILDEKIENGETINVYCRDKAEDEYQKEFIDGISNFKITYNESKYLIKKIDSTLEYGYIVTVKDIMTQILEQIDTTDYMSYAAVSEDLYNIATAVINIKRQCRSLDADQTFSLEQEMFEQVVGDAVNKLRDRNRIFITGIRHLNVILSPGFLSKRLYTFLAFPGKGKSTMLLKAAMDIRKYNSGIKTKNPDKRPAVLFLTLENDIAETVERMYNMSVTDEDIRNYTPNQVIKAMQEEGGLKLTDKSPIDIIIKEYKNRELNTDDLYSIINDLSDQGIEVVTLIVDYMKRIRPTEPGQSEKEELKNITNELKELAKFFDIPVITAQQLNRNGAAIVDAALQNNKDDVTRLVGRDAIAGAWEINILWSPRIVIYVKTTSLIAGTNSIGFMYETILETEIVARSNFQGIVKSIKIETIRNEASYEMCVQRLGKAQLIRLEASRSDCGRNVGEIRNGRLCRNTDEDIVWLTWKHDRMKSIENSDWVCIVNPQIKRDTSDLYMTFKMLKRRYRSTEENEKLRRLDYFNQPFEKGNDIRLVDDIDMDEAVALLSLSAEFDEVDPSKKRGSSHAIDREIKKRKDKFDIPKASTSLFDEFDEDQSDYTTVVVSGEPVNA